MLPNVKIFLHVNCNSVGSERILFLLKITKSRLRQSINSTDYYSKYKDLKIITMTKSLKYLKNDNCMVTN